MNVKNNFISRRFIVSGKVQGVFFRASTKQQALKLELTGYAKNLQSGQVEVLVQGDKDSVNDLVTWLGVGPQYAQVDSVVEVDASDSELLVDFKVL